MRLRCADRTKRKHRALAATDAASGKRKQCQNAALTIIVGAHQEDDIFDGNNQYQRPKRETEYAKYRCFLNTARRRAVVERLAKGIKRAGTDVAEDDANGANSERRE